jgi:hypothetical protein
MSGQKALETYVYKTLEHGSSHSVGLDSLQTSDVLEIHKGKKFKAIVEEKISVHYLSKTNGDTSYYKIVNGEFLLFTHDSITRQDSLILKSNAVQKYYIINNDNREYKYDIVVKNPSHNTTIDFTSISKIVIGRKTYKFKPTKANELVWSLGE